MPEIVKEECRLRIVKNGSKDGAAFNGTTFYETANMFEKNLVQVEGDGSFFLASEDEVIGVEHLLAEPKCNDLDDAFLGHNTYHQYMCFNFEELSTVEYGFRKTNNDALGSNPKLSEIVKEFSDGVLRGSDAIVIDGKNNFSDTCEDYLLDTEFVDEASDFNLIKGPYVGNSGLERKCMVSEGRGCGSEISELSSVSIPVPQATCQDFTLFDEMTIHELHEAFRNMFGRETTVTDKQWLKRHLSFGLQNLHVPSSKNEGKMILPTSDQCSTRMSSPFTGVFNFKRKPRVRHVKREGNDNHISLKALSTEVGTAVSGFSVSGEKKSVLVTRKRLRKPTRRYIEESLEQNSRPQKRRYGISNACSRDKMLNNGSYKQHYQSQKEPFKGACIQVPFGQPAHRGRLKKKVHEYEGSKDSRLSCSILDTDMESFSTESQDDTSSEDDYSSGAKIQKGKSRRKNHIYWSLSEVLKLIEGVSMHGVGRWSKIKKLLFHASANRTSVDLKDKWRNLLRASCPQLKSNREVESGKKHVANSIPESILHRVRELAVIHPYPRERKTQVSRTLSVASPTILNTNTTLLPLSTAVRV